MIHHPESLGAFRWATVRLYCPDCHRFAQFSKAGLIMRFGAEIHGHTLLNRLLPCDRRTDGVGAVPCQLRYWDRMSREAREKALAEMESRGGLPKGWMAD
jgi:hypothetical protein